MLALAMLVGLDVFLTRYSTILQTVDLRYQAPADSRVSFQPAMATLLDAALSAEDGNCGIWGEHDLLRERSKLTPEIIDKSSTLQQGVRMTEPQLSELHVLLMTLSPVYAQLWHDFCVTVGDNSLVAAQKQPRTSNGNLQPCAINYMRKHLWHQWAMVHRREFAHLARYWGHAQDFKAAGGVRWGPVNFNEGSWAMADPIIHGSPLQPVNEQALPGVMRTPSRLCFVHVQQVFQLKLPFSIATSATATEWHAVLHVHWHQSPLGAAFDAELQAPLINMNHEPLSGLNARCPYVLPQHLLPLGFTVRQYTVSSTGKRPSNAVLVALRRTWQPLSVVGAQPPWPRLMHYVSPAQQ
jgi:hypothetical protein